MRGTLKPASHLTPRVWRGRDSNPRHHDFQAAGRLGQLFVVCRGYRNRTPRRIPAVSGGFGCLWVTTLARDPMRLTRPTLATDESQLKRRDGTEAAGSERWRQCRPRRPSLTAGSAACWSRDAISPPKFDHVAVGVRAAKPRTISAADQRSPLVAQHPRVVDGAPPGPRYRHRRGLPVETPPARLHPGVRADRLARRPPPIALGQASRSSRNSSCVARGAGPRTSRRNRSQAQGQQPLARDRRGVGFRPHRQQHPWLERPPSAAGKASCHCSGAAVEPSAASRPCPCRSA